MSSSDNWKFCFLLHNLELKAAFESEFMAIVPNNDARLAKIIADEPLVAPLIQNFTDQQGKQKCPCALIGRTDAPHQIGSLEGIIGFRNIFALSCLLYAWPQTIGSRNVSFPQWSDFFDFYPMRPSKDGTFLHTLSPAIDGGCLPEKFKGQVSPNLPPDVNSLKFQPDDQILPLLLDVWKKEFAETNSPDWTRTVLFRSLEMAYQAARLPSNSRYTIYDFGTPIALWVSAFEVLVHPGMLPDGKKGKADIEKVMNLLGQALWRDLRLKHTEHQIKNLVNVNLVQKLYGELYEARNDFLHGNQVDHSRLFCFRNEHRRSLIEIAPVIYKVALGCSLGQFGDTRTTSDGQPNYKEHFERSALENALLATLEDRK
jgi:hypothetical protein